MNLAIHTGTPLFPTLQHVGSPIIEPETRKRFLRLQDDAFARNYFSNNGPFLQRLEEDVANRHKVAHAVVVSNATLAQLLVLKAMGLDHGEALVGGDTFIATAHTCAWEGMRVRFVDIDPETLNMDPDDAERKMTADTRVIIPTHVFGAFADMARLKDIAARHNACVIADAAHCFDCDQGGIMAGGFGVPEWISFHATKFFSTFEGGAIVTNDDALAREVKALRAFGLDQPGHNRMVGLNAKLSEIHAAMGLASLPALEERRHRLCDVRQAYLDILEGIPGVRVHPVGLDGTNNYRYLAIFVGKDFGVPRDVLVEVLRRENIALQLYFSPGCQRMDYYRNTDPVMAESLPVTDRMLGNIVCLPTSFVHADQVESAKLVAGIIEAVQLQSGRVLDWWRSSRRRD